jgi:hypothetical protein
MISPKKLNDLTSSGLTSTLAGYFFDNPKTIINLGGNGKNPTAAQVAAVHADYPHAGINLLFNSVGVNALTGAPGIQGYLGSGQVPTGVSYIQYDAEGSANGTPAAESAALESNDLTYSQQAATLIHSHGLKYIFSPSATSGMTDSQGGMNRYQTWLQQGRGQWSKTSGADIYAIQNQQAEGTATYQTFTGAAVAQAKAADPATLIFLGIGINPTDPPTAITTQDIMNAYALGQSLGVAGYWNNVQTNAGANVSPSVYVGFFQQLYSAKQ